MPLEIHITKDGTITINVDLNRRNEVAAAAVTAQDQESIDLEMRLMTTEDSNEEKTMSLNMDILKYAKRKLKSGKKKDLLKFLNDNKQRFNSDLKDWLKEIIQVKVK